MWLDIQRSFSSDQLQLPVSLNVEGGAVGVQKLKSATELIRATAAAKKNAMQAVGDLVGINLRKARPH